MSIKSVKNQSFKGVINISGLSAKQQQVVDGIYPVLKKQVESVKNLNLNISGSLDKRIISRAIGKEPKYILLSTQVKSATVPTANIAVESTNPQYIMQQVKNIIKKHTNSDFYKKTLLKENKPNSVELFFSGILSAFGFDKLLNNLLRR